MVIGDRFIKANNRAKQNCGIVEAPSNTYVEYEEIQKITKFPEAMPIKREKIEKYLETQSFAKYLINEQKKKVYANCFLSLVQKNTFNCALKTINLIEEIKKSNNPFKILKNSTHEINTELLLRIELYITIIRVRQYITIIREQQYNNDPVLSELSNKFDSLLNGFKDKIEKEANSQLLKKIADKEVLESNFVKKFSSEGRGSR